MICVYVCVTHVYHFMLNVYEVNIFIGCCFNPDVYSIGPGVYVYLYWTNILNYLLTFREEEHFIPVCRCYGDIHCFR